MLYIRKKGLFLDIPGKDYQSFDGFKNLNPGGYSTEIISRNPVFVGTLNKEITFINNLTDPDPLLRRAAHDLLIFLKMKMANTHLT